MYSHPNVKALVLDATPLITQSYSHYQNYAESFYTTPTVFNEIRDENARKNIEIWQGLGTLNIRHPKEASIKRVSQFAKLTGDYSVLSANDLHILALAYELEVQLNEGDWRLRSKPGDLLTKLKSTSHSEAPEQPPGDGKVTEAATTVSAGKKKRRRGGKKQRAKREAVLAENGKLTKSEQLQPSEQEENAAAQVIPQVEPDEQVGTGVQQPAELVEDYNEDDDDGDWITPENLTEALIKDSGEDVTGNEGAETVGITAENQVALATGDFAIQNVALQLNLNLMNFMSGMRIKRLRNYMLRCHACFKMYPLPKDGKTKHFCSACGGCSTLIRCAVSVDSETGEVTPHLKANFQWNNRGNRYSLASPLSKNSQKRFGKKGFVHTKHAQDVILLHEDQKEYQQALKQDDWTRRNNEKVLNDWIGGGSADNCISPFAISGLKHHSVRVGRGRHINSAKKRV